MECVITRSCVCEASRSDSTGMRGRNVIRHILLPRNSIQSDSTDRPCWSILFNLNTKKANPRSPSLIRSFLQATKGDLVQTRTRLKNCLLFRQSWNLYSPRSVADQVSPESPCGKEFLYGYSKRGEPVLYFYPNRSDTEVGERQMRHTV